MPRESAASYAVFGLFMMRASFFDSPAVLDKRILDLERSLGPRYLGQPGAGEALVKRVQDLEAEVARLRGGR